MSLIKTNTAQSEKMMLEKRVHWDSKFTTNKDKVLQSSSKRRRYMRRGSKSASMFRVAATKVQIQYDATERVSREIRGSSVLLRRTQESMHDNVRLRAPLKHYSTKSLMDEQAFQEKLLQAPPAQKATKIVMV